jgi:hypothetical protein
MRNSILATALIAFVVHSAPALAQDLSITWPSIANGKVTPN